MNFGLKHLIIFIFSFALLFATLFVPRQIKNEEKMRDTEFGYPVAFISQDFSKMRGFIFFPNWQKFQPKNDNYSYKIFPLKFITSLGLIFLSLELLISLLETIKHKLIQKFSKDTNSKKQ